MTDYNAEKVSRTDCTPWRDEETLRHFYRQKRYSIAETARAVGCSAASVSKWLDRLDIDKRTHTEQLREDSSPDELRDGDGYLREQYVKKGRSMRDIADELDVASGTVNKWLNRHGIETRSLTESQRLRGPSELNDREKLRELYVEERMSGSEIAKQIGTNTRSVHRRLHAFGIDVRGTGSCGENHPAYKTGEHVNNYGGNWEEQAAKCRSRDGHECVVCGKTQPDRKLDVHHLVPFRSFDSAEEANRLDNLVSTCRSCHRRVERLSPLLPSNAVER